MAQYFTTSPNMQLLVPTVGQELGPTWAQDLNYNFQTLIDQHDHSIGHGVQITPSGLNINSALTMQGNSLLFLLSGSFVSQGGLLSDLTTVYVSGGNLYYNDNLGNQIQITASGTINVAPGVIPGLNTPASLTYNSALNGGTFLFQSDVNTGANLDIASIVIRNLVPNSFGITLQAPVLSLDYSLTLPSRPLVQSFMTLNAAGQMAAPWTVDNNTIGVGPVGSIPSNQIGVRDGGITATQIAANTITNAKLAQMPANTLKGNNTGSTATPVDLTVSEVRTLLSVSVAPTVTVYTGGSGTYTTPTGTSYIKVQMVGGGGGSGSGGSNGASSVFGPITAGGGSSGGSGNSNGYGGAGGGYNLGGITTGFGVNGQPGGGTFKASLGGTLFGSSGASGGNSYFGGAGSSTTGYTNAAPNSGSGGGSFPTSGSSGGITGYGAGGAGGYVEVIIDSPSSTYSWQVGAGGSSTGASGIIIIQAY